MASQLVRPRANAFSRRVAGQGIIDPGTAPRTPLVITMRIAARTSGCHPSFRKRMQESHSENRKRSDPALWKAYVGGCPVRQV
jgi:hypothetical protein